jgi:elongation factor P
VENLMAQVDTNDLKAGMKLEIDRNPYVVVDLEFVKPGKGQAFTRVRIKNLMTSRVVEKTYKSGEKLDLADVEEKTMRMLYKEADGVVFMEDDTFEQLTIPMTIIGDNENWLMEEQTYDIVFFKGEVISITPPTFLDMVISETAPGVRGDTASGRVLKPAITESGAKVQIPIFIEQGEKIRVVTRTGEYVSRVQS